MSDCEERSQSCIYCGTPIKTGRACRRHAQLPAIDPHVGGLRRPLEEHELGVRLPWPEGEAEDRGGDES